MNKPRYIFSFLLLALILLVGFEQASALVFSDNDGTQDLVDIPGQPSTGTGGGGTIGSGAITPYTILGTLSFEPLSVKGGQTFKISLTGGPKNNAIKIWVDNSDGKGFRDFGAWNSTDESGNITAYRTLDCNNYLTLEPNQVLAIGNRKLTQKVYIEYVGLGKISSTATHTKDCTTNPILTPITDPATPNTGTAPDAPYTPRPTSVTNNNKWPVTVQSIRGKNYVTVPFPTKVGEPLSYCEVADDCRTWMSQYGQDYGLGLTNERSSQYINGQNTRVYVTTPTKLPTFQYTSPFKKFVGRYLDGGTNPDGLMGWAKDLNLPTKIIFIPQKNRIYIQEHSALAAYNADTFFEAIQNEPLKYFFGGKNNLGVIPWDAHFFSVEGQDNYSSKLGVNAWILNVMDTMGEALYDYDVDDRGYIYMYTIDGFGVAKDAGSVIKPVMQIPNGVTWDSPGSRTEGKQEIYQTGSAGTNKVIRESVDMNKGPLFTFKSNGKYYISVGAHRFYDREYSPGNGYGSNTVFDMTNPLKPEFVADGNTGKEQKKFIRIPSGQDDIIAVETFNADRSNSIEIYKASEFAMGGDPSKTFTAESFLIPGGGQRQCEGYNGLTADNVSGKLYSFSCVKEGTKFMAKLSVFSPTNISDPTTYTETKHNLGAGYEFAYEISRMSPDKTYITNRSGDGIRFSNGYLTAPVQASYPLPGRVNTSAGAFNGYMQAEDIAVWVMRDGKPVKLETNNFTAKYYVQAPEGYAKANTAGYYYSQLMTYGGKDYLFYSGQQQGDVYELEPVSRDVSTKVDACVSIIPGGPCITGGGSGSNVTTPPPFVSCEESAGDDIQDRDLCGQIMKVQMKSCKYIPSLPFCKNSGGGADGGGREQNAI